jgi:hypothetical protein
MEWAPVEGRIVVTHAISTLAAMPVRELPSAYPCQVSSRCNPKTLDVVSGQQANIPLADIGVQRKRRRLPTCQSPRERPVDLTGNVTARGHSG